MDKNIKRGIGQHRVTMPTPESPIRVASFGASLGADCRVVVLGSMPGARSLALNQYYGHPQNLFWPFMGELCGAGLALEYSERLQHLHRAGIGLWDVLQQCERRGSLDSAIVGTSEQPNDLVQLLLARPTIRALAFNGSKAWQAYRRHLQPRWPAELAARVQLLKLPSTSPANASIPRASKLAEWLRLREHL